MTRIVFLSTVDVFKYLDPDRVLRMRIRIRKVVVLQRAGRHDPGGGCQGQERGAG